MWFNENCWANIDDMIPCKVQPTAVENLLLSFINCMAQLVLTLRLRQYSHHFGDDILKCIFLNENVWISIKISLKFVPNGPINNIPVLV